MRSSTRDPKSFTKVQCPRFNVNKAVPRELQISSIASRSTFKQLSKFSVCSKEHCDSNFAEVVEIPAFFSSSSRRRCKFEVMDSRQLSLIWPLQVSIRFNSRRYGQNCNPSATASDPTLQPCKLSLSRFGVSSFSSVQTNRNHYLQQ